jgi:hypothetical protein
VDGKRERGGDEFNDFKSAKKMFSGCRKEIIVGRNARL